MRKLAILFLVAATAFADDAAELRFLRAWYSLEDPDKTTAAEVTLQRLLEDETTPRELKGRCLLGLARGAGIRGDRDAAHAYLVRLTTDFADLTELQRRAGRMRGRPGYLTGLVRVKEDDYLDLDTGGILRTARGAPGVASELHFDRLIVAEKVEDPDMAALAMPLSGKPWFRVSTNEGRTSWVQRLGTPKQPVIRFITKWGGGKVLPAPRGAAAVGGDDGITLWFEPARVFQRYRIERRRGKNAFEQVGIVDHPPFVDGKTEDDQRYAYRITGLTEAGDPGLPLTLSATRASLGVTTGVAELSRGPSGSFDFLVGDLVATGEGDLTLTRTYGGRSGASFTDWLGRSVRASSGGGDPTSAWDHDARGKVQIVPGNTFLVPLRDGGVARCRVVMGPRQGRPDVFLHYEAYGDGARLPDPVRLEAARDGDAVTVRVRAGEHYRVERIRVHEVMADDDLQPLIVRDGVATDPTAQEGQIRVYSAFGTDAHGRRSATAVARLSLLDSTPKPGEFRFHYEQGYSIERKQIVPAEDADVVFSSCAGGIASIELTAPGGIVNLEKLLLDDPRFRDVPALQLFERVTAADAGLGLDRKASGDSRDGRADVFIMRTRNGGWAKLVIAHRAGKAKGGWQKLLATIEYVFNAGEPRFGQGHGDDAGGVRFIGLDALNGRRQVIEAWQQGWSRISQDAELQEKFGKDEAVAAGRVPGTDKSQEVLLARSRYRDYVKATYSFLHGVRDDAELRTTNNDWCVEYGNGADTLWVRTVADDESTITNLGVADWAGIAARTALPEEDNERLQARHGHVYLIHTLDPDTNLLALMRITAMQPGDAIAFEWVMFDEGRLTMSPGLALDDATSGKLKALLWALPVHPDARWINRDIARKTYERLGGPTLRIGVVDEDVAALLSQVASVTGVRMAADGIKGSVSIFGSRMTPRQIVREIAAQTGTTWTVADDGTVKFER